MKVPRRAPAWLLLFSLGAADLLAQDWTEAQVIEKFLDQSPYARKRVRASTPFERKQRGRTLLPNPNAIATREGAGYAAFFQLEQQLPLSGRRGLLKQAGAAAISLTEAQSAITLWSLR